MGEVFTRTDNVVTFSIVGKHGNPEKAKILGRIINNVKYEEYRSKNEALRVSRNDELPGTRNAVNNNNTLFNQNLSNQ